MSKESIEKIKAAESDAKELVKRAMEESGRMISAAREEAAKEKKDFSAKLRRERNERILRCELSGQKAQEKADEEIKELLHRAKERYDGFLEAAVRAATDVILGR